MDKSVKEFASITGCHIEIAKLAMKLSKGDIIKGMYLLGTNAIPSLQSLTSRNEPKEETTIQEDLDKEQNKQDIQSLNDIIYIINIAFFEEGDDEFVINFDEIHDEQYQKLNENTKNMLKEWIIKKKFNVDFEYKNNSWRIWVDTPIKSKFKFF